VRWQKREKNLIRIDAVVRKRFSNAALFRREIAALQCISSFGACPWSPRLLFADSSRNVLVEENLTLSGCVPAEEADVEQVLAALQKYFSAVTHSSDRLFNRSCAKLPRFNSSEFHKKALSALKALGAPRALVNAANNYTFAHTTLVHGDLRLRHIFVYPPCKKRLTHCQCEVRLIDWEFAFFGDINHDYATLWLDLVRKQNQGKPPIFWYQQLSKFPIFDANSFWTHVFYILNNRFDLLLAAEIAKISGRIFYANMLSGDF